MRLTIAGEKLKMTHPVGPMAGSIFTDATQNPKTFHAVGNNLNWVGIYERDGDTLTLCMGTGNAAERPMEFKSNPAALLVLRRLKQGVSQRHDEWRIACHNPVQAAGGCDPDSSGFTVS